MKTLNVDLGERSYPIYIGADLLAQEQLLQQHIRARQVMVISNETVAPLYLEALQRQLKPYQVQTVILPDGEQYKNLEMVNRIYDALLEHRFDRQCTLIALGGGVIGDITGFAAATYQRGVNFIQVPTTLLAQVDSSVGGKTGVNHPKGKNMIGAFYQPKCVLADTNTLNTLEQRQLSAGIAEVIKYGILGDPEFFTWLEQNMEALMAREADSLSYAIERSCQNKAAIVAADEKEAGQRALLNLGHTFGHAIEAGMGYGSWLHGEAVGTGMVMAADLSLKHQWLTEEEYQRIEHLIDKAGLPIRAPMELSPERFLELMAHDKKVADGHIQLILVKGIGNALVSKDYDPNLLQQTLEQVRA